MHKDPEHPSDQDPSTEGQGPDNDKAKGVNRKPKVRAWILWTFITGFLGVAAQFVESWDHSLLIPSLVLFFSAFPVGARALWIHLTNNGETHKRALTKAFLVVLIGFVACGSLFWWKHRLAQNADLLEASNKPPPKSKPHPHFTYSAYVGEPVGYIAKASVQLTNEFLFCRDRKWFPTGFLVLPTQIGQSNVTFNLVVQNVDPSAVARDTQVSISVTTNLMCVPEGTGWQKVIHENAYSIVEGVRVKTEVQSWGVTCPPLLPGDSIGPLGLSLKILGRRGWGDMEILIRAEDSPAEMLVFHLMFAAPNVLNEPLMTLLRTNLAGQQILVSSAVTNDFRLHLHD